MRKGSWMVVLVVLGALVVACSGSEATPTRRLAAIDVGRITLVEAKELLDDGAALLLDTRSLKSYQGGHAAGAVSYPQGDAAARAGELPGDKALIFYCA